MGVGHYMAESEEFWLLEIGLRALTKFTKIGRISQETMQCIKE